MNDDGIVFNPMKPDWSNREHVKNRVLFSIHFIVVPFYSSIQKSIMLQQNCRDCRHGPLFDDRFPGPLCELLLTKVLDRPGFTLTTIWSCPDWSAPIRQPQFDQWRIKHYLLFSGPGYPYGRSWTCHIVFHPYEKAHLRGFS
jgi:hypothetical protein